MTTGMIEVTKVLLFALVGGFSFVCGYLTRYILSDDEYIIGYKDGFERGRTKQKIIDTTDKS